MFSFITAFQSRFMPAGCDVGPVCGGCCVSDTGLHAPRDLEPGRRHRGKSEGRQQRSGLRSNQEVGVSSLTPAGLVLTWSRVLSLKQKRLR